MVWSCGCHGLGMRLALPSHLGEGGPRRCPPPGCCGIRQTQVSVGKSVRPQEAGGQIPCCTHIGCETGAFLIVCFPKMEDLRGSTTCSNCPPPSSSKSAHSYTSTLVQVKRNAGNTSVHRIMKPLTLAPVRCITYLVVALSLGPACTGGSPLRTTPIASLLPLFLIVITLLRCALSCIATCCCLGNSTSCAQKPLHKRGVKRGSRRAPSCVAQLSPL
jgi:hypothetical protein